MILVHLQMNMFWEALGFAITRFIGRWYAHCLGLGPSLAYRKRMERVILTLLFLVISATNAYGETSLLCKTLLLIPRLANRDMVTRNRFPTDRGLKIPSHEVESWPKSDSNFAWLDSGAGHGNAAREFLELYPESKIRIVGVSRIIRDGSFHSDRFQHLSGRFLEEIPNEELGRFNYITDYYGPFSYTEQIDVVLQKYIDLLKVGGKIQIKGQYINRPAASGLLGYLISSIGGGPVLDYYKRYKIKTIADGFNAYNVYEWLQLFEGIKVTSKGEDDLLIEKLTESPQRLTSLSLRWMTSGRPPLRYYRVTN